MKYREISHLSRCSDYVVCSEMFTLVMLSSSREELSRPFLVEPSLMTAVVKSRD